MLVSCATLKNTVNEKRHGFIESNHHDNDFKWLQGNY